jgi:tight adherence protein B
LTSAVILFAFISGTLLGVVGLMALFALLNSYRDAFTSTAQNTLGELFLFVDARRLFRYNLGLLAIVPMLVEVVTDSVPLAIGALILLAILPRFVYRHLQGKRLKQFIVQLPDALMALSSSLRAGSSMLVSLEKLIEEQRPPLSQEFELFLREQRMGVDFDTALDHMAKRIAHPDFQLVAAGMRISREVGGNLAGILETQADILRSKAMMEGKIVSLTAQGKLQGLVMTFLPMVLAAILYLMEPDAMMLLFTTRTGWVVLVVIAVMETLGYLSIRKITAIDV